ncbi:hypothetical protein N8334_00220 [Flavobacteriaceae bacterium]|nr:hypothetical protein [Flavobacteriaceae bacterium]|tara:strand:+ start:600 stop:1307 length:708 start_codon:yes stop_codon:yes gene_type:complete
MIRYIKIEDENKRDAEITFKSVTQKNSVYLALENGVKPINKKVIKSSKDFTLETLTGKLDPSDEELNNFSEKLLNQDIEIDFELFGKFIDKTDRIYTNKNLNPVFNVDLIEKVFDTEGNLKEERKPTYLNSNISGESILKWTGKYIPKNKIYNKVVLSSKYQIKHVNGLTFDFLYKISKTLNDKDSFMVIGGGKGNEPLVFNDGGKPYRGFLEGKVNENSYCLILHLSNQEYKTI